MRPKHSAARVSVWLGIVLLTSGFDAFRSSNGDVADGNKKLSQGKVKEALKAYEKAAKSLPEDPGIQYNLGIARYRLGEYQPARNALLKATGASDPDLKARALYNLGNALYKLEQFEDAADAYRRSLRVDPSRKAAKWNLELALKRIEEKKKKEDEKKKKKQSEKDKKPDQRDQDPKKPQQDKQGGQPRQEQKQQQDQEGSPKDKPEQKPTDKQQHQQQKDKQQPSDKQQQPRQSPQQRELGRTLDALDRSDKNLQKRRLKMLYGGRRRPPSKDW